MKKTITTAILTFAQICGFSQEASLQDVSNTKFDITVTHTELQKPKDSLKYTNMIVTMIPGVGAKPGIGWGYRLISEDSALDFAISSVEGRHERTRGSAWMFPRINYLRYLTPQEDHSLYLGGGIGFGGIYSHNGLLGGSSKFTGLIANASFGYEMYRTANFRSFVQLDLNQPTVATVRSGNFPSAWTALSIGAGF